MKTAAVIVLLSFVIHTNAQVPELTPQSGNPAPVISFVSEKGTNRVYTGDKIGNVICWDAVSGRQLRSYRGLNADIDKLVLSPKGIYIAALSEKGEVNIWETLTGRRAGVHLMENYGKYIDAAFGTEEEFIYLTSSKGGFYRRHISDYSRSTGVFSGAAYDTAGNKRIVESVYSPVDSNWYALLKNGTAYSLIIRNLGPGEQVYPLAFKGPRSIRVSANGLYLGILDKGIINIYDPVSGNAYTEINTGIDTLEYYEFSPDGMRVLVPEGPDKLNIYHQLTGDMYDKLETERKGMFLAGKMIDDRIAAYKVGAVLVYDLMSRKKTSELKGNVRYISGLEFYGDGNYLAAASLVEGLNILRPDGRTLNLPVKKDGVRLIAVSPDEKIIAAADVNYLGFFDAKTGERLFAVDTAIGNLQTMVFSRNSKDLYIGLTNSMLLRYSLQEKSFILKREFNGEVFAIAYHPAKDELAMIDLGRQITVINPVTFEIIKKSGNHPSVLYDVKFSPDGRYIAGAVQDTGIYVWDYEQDTLAVLLRERYEIIYELDFSADGKILAAGAVGGAVLVYRTDTWEKIREFENPGAYLGIISISQDGRYVAAITGTGQARVWNIETGKESFTFTGFNESDWAVTMPDGRFDASQEGMKLLHFVKGFDVFPLESFFNENYLPGLAGDILTGKVEELDSAAIAQKFLFKLPPDAVITSPTIKSKLRSGKNLIDISVTDRGGGIKWLRLYLNDKLIEEKDYTGRPVLEGEKITITMTAELLADTNKISVVAASLNNIESLPAILLVEAQGSKPRSKLYIVGIGINKYENPAYNLAHAESDIRTLRDKIIKGTGKMVSDAEEYIYFSKDAVRENISAAFDSIAAKAKASDIFILLYSGHGVFRQEEKSGGDFYFVLHDVINMYSADSTTAAKGISAKELREYSTKIAANKQLLIIDACQAGGAVETFALRGAAEEKAIQSLARSSGMFLLASSAKNSAAKELPALGMGLYSYALSEALNCFGDYDKDGLLSVKEMEFFARTKLEELQKKYKLAPQYPMSWMIYQDFPVGICR